MSKNFIKVLLFCVLNIVAMMGDQVTRESEQHVRDLIEQLPSNSILRRDLLSGARGDGVHRFWMDTMRQVGVKRVVAWVSIRFDRGGKPKEMMVARTEYFTEYENGGRVLDDNSLKSIRASGLEQMLTPIAVEMARHGHWIDVPRPRPNPFVGAARVQFFDDEWLPAIKKPLFCAGNNCTTESNTVP